MKMLYHSLDLRFDPDDPRAKDARIIAAKMDHLNRFVDRILHLARTDEPDFARVNVNGIIEELGLLVRHKFKHQQVAFVARLQPDLPTIRGDSGQLEQAFLNLMLNAVDAMPQGGTLGVTSRFVAATSPAGGAGHVAVEFQDTGHGMDPRQRRNASSPLLRSDKPKGAGLGLAVVSRIVEAHRGRIEIKSAVGKGTIVILVLPLAGREDPPAK
jgi:signal transduction histidine kinase